MPLRVHMLTEAGQERVSIRAHRRGDANLLMLRHPLDVGILNFVEILRRLSLVVIVITTDVPGGCARLWLHVRASVTLGPRDCQLICDELCCIRHCLAAHARSRFRRCVATATEMRAMNSAFGSAGCSTTLTHCFFTNSSSCTLLRPYPTMLSERGKWPSSTS